MLKAAMMVAASLAATSLRASSDIPCIERTPAEIQKSINFWNAFEKTKAQPMGLDVPTQEESLREFGSPLAEDRLSHFLTAQRINAMRFATYSFVDTPVTAVLFVSPFNAIGRMFVLDNAVEKACTAFFVGDPKVLMTAAHCVFDRVNSKFFTNIQYTRVYNRNGGGQDFGIAKVAIAKEWITSSTPHDFDFAFLRTTASAPVTPLTFATLGLPKDWIAVGYPKDLVFDGQTMMHAGGVAGTAPTVKMIRMVGNPMGPGTSGGPFLPPGFPPQNAFGSAILSVGSLKLTADTVDGPLLGDRALAVFNNVKDVTGDCAP